MKFQPLDFVKTPKGQIGFVTDVSSNGDCSIAFLGGKGNGEKSAWWSPKDGLIIVDSLPSLLAREIVHPFNDNAKKVANKVFPVDRK